MSTRNRHGSDTRTASQSNASQPDKHEVESATLADIETRMIGDSFEVGGVIVSVSHSCTDGRRAFSRQTLYHVRISCQEFQNSPRSQGFTQSKEISQKQTPKVQEDLFYGPSLNFATSKLPEEPASSAKSATNSSNLRALRFSSPLEGSYKKEMTDIKQMRSSLKKRLASAERGGDITAVEVSTDAVQVQQAPVVIVNPVRPHSVSTAAAQKLTLSLSPLSDPGTASAKP